MGDFFNLNLSDNSSKELWFLFMYHKTVFTPDGGQIRIECEAGDYFVETVFIDESEKLTNI